MYLVLNQLIIMNRLWNREYRVFFEGFSHCVSPTPRLLWLSMLRSDRWLNIIISLIVPEQFLWLRLVVPIVDIFLRNIGVQLLYWQVVIWSRVMAFWSSEVTELACTSIFFPFSLNGFYVQIYAFLIWLWVTHSFRWRVDGITSLVDRFLLNFVELSPDVLNGLDVVG